MDINSSKIMTKYFTKILMFILVMVWLSLMQSVKAQQKATWIWYPGDFEINLANKMQNRRTDRGSFFPVFWKMDSHYNLIDFHKNFELSAPEEVNIAVEGTYNIKIDGQALFGFP